MAYPRIRLQNYGDSHHKIWKIVVMSKNKCHKGRYIEKLGYWIPNKRVTVDRAIVYNKHRLNYWLSVGAQPTEKVHKLLAKYFHKNRWGLDRHETMNDYFYLQKINEMRTILEKKNNLDREALNE